MAIFNTNTGGIIFENKMPNVENVDPRSFLKTFHMRAILPIYVRWMDCIFGGMVKHLFPQIREFADLDAENIIVKAENMALPPEIYSILDNDLRKKDQIKLLRNLTISKEQLGGIFLQAGKRDYKLSTYHFEIKPKHIKDLPSYVFCNNKGEMIKSDDTELSDDELKAYLNAKYYIVVRILDNGKHWHCFFQTKRGVIGNEPGDYGSKPHIHYFSDSFGLSKKHFISRIKNNGKVPASPVHILITD